MFNMTQNDTTSFSSRPNFRSAIYRACYEAKTHLDYVKPIFLMNAQHSTIPGHS